MIRPSIVWRIFRREVVDVCRDWSMLFVVVLLPFALAPLTTVALVEIEGQQAAEEATERNPPPHDKTAPAVSPYRIALLGPASGLLEKKIHERLGFAVSQLPDFSSRDSGALHTALADQPRSPEVIAFQEEIRRRIAAGEVDAVLVTGEGKLPDKNLTNISAVLLLDETIPRSRKAGRKVEEIVEKLRPELRAERLKILGQTEEGLRPLRFSTKQVAPIARQFIYSISHILPALLITLLALGCYYSGVNSIPGEKERGTLATVLSAPVRPLELLLGKWLSVTLIGLVSAFATTLSMIVTGMVLIRSLATEAAKNSPETAALFLSSFGAKGLFALVRLWPDLGLLLLCLAMVGMVLGALTLVVCLFARGTNDATYLLTPFLLVVLMLAAAPALPTMKWNLSGAITPLLSQALMIRGIFRQETMGTGLILLSFASSGLFSLLALVFGARVFDSERIRFNESGGLKDVLRHGIGTPGAGISALAAALLVGGAFYVNLATSSGIRSQILASQAWVVALPLALIWFLRLPWRETLAWHAPRLSVWPSAILLGLTAGAMVSPLLKLFPLPELWVKAFSEPFLKMVAEPGGPLLAFTLVALLPAFCEEIAFRGLIQAGFLKRFTPGVAIILTSLCFGLAHLSIYRFLPTMALGLILGWVAWRTKSIFPGMVIHALNNSLALASMTAARDAPSLSAWPAAIAMVMAFALGIWGIYRCTRVQTVANPVNLPPASDLGLR